MVKPWSPVCKSRGDPSQIKKKFFSETMKFELVIMVSNMANSLVIAASSNRCCICIEQHIFRNDAIFGHFSDFPAPRYLPACNLFGEIFGSKVYRDESNA